MTEVQYSRLRGLDGSAIHDLSVSGHAMYDDAGKDIVCAGISAITYALLGFAINDDNSGILDYSVESGKVELLCIGGDALVGAMEMALIGYMQIAHKYPDYIKIETADFGQQEEITSSGG